MLRTDSSAHGADVLRPEKSSILIVDDRTENLIVFRSMLEELGQDIVAVQSGEEALRKLLRHDFAVILLDVNMPGMDGLETAGYIRQRRRTAHTPIIFLTAYIEEMHTAKGYSLCAVDYIMTPVMPEVLRTKVKVFVQLHQMQRHAEREAEHRVALAHEQAARATVEASRRRSAFLAEASHVLASSLDVETTVRSIAHFVVPFLADFGAIALSEADEPTGFAAVSWISEGDMSSRHDIVLAGVDHPALLRAMREAIALRRPVLLNDFGQPGEKLTGLAMAGGAIEPLEPALSLQLVAVLPLLARGRTLGVLLLGIGPSGRAFDALALELATDFAGRVAVALDNCTLYARIQEQDQRKNEFLAMLAHELRNPLAPIRNAVQLLDMPSCDDDRIAWATRVLDRQSMQLVRLVDDLLDVARITQGQITLKSENVDVTSVLQMAVETCSSLIRERQHEITVKPPNDPVSVRGDAARIAQVLANLLNNAAKYTDTGGRIVITAEADANDVVFRVQDTGVGIRREMLARIFDLFTQADRTLDRSQGGLGVGLTIVQRLVQLHGGTVEALSEGPQLGAEFIVRLPRAIEEARPTQRADEAAAGPALASILVVDDYADSADALASLLRVDGHAVYVCHDGEAAVEIARRMRPDVILLDIGLPGMNGFEVAKALRSRAETRQCRLVALSGYGQPADLQQSRNAGFDHHLVKPAEPQVLRELFASLGRKERGDTG